ncbi:proteasome assembly chaperone 2-like [Uranotaenia lowii]|uniref:proteasome assembly chaperone 2-like n=1 Tax=Uranotaenia lowii TaxID=190385 RepID=UPI00247B03E2|nr:proteasome assembly chaperone 2-like [Uranotaenia lowii]
MFKLFRSESVSGFSFVVPSVSVGNVAQLAVDLLIETLKLSKVGLLWHPALIPVAGPAAYAHDSDKITTTAELFASDEHKLLVLQLRAPLVGSLTADFLTSLSDFVESQKLGDVFILSSSFAHENQQIGSRFKYVATEAFLSKRQEALTQLKWPQLEGSVIHGGGFAMKLQQLLVARNQSGLVLFSYVSEGDNTTDAVNLVSLLDQIREPVLLPRDDEQKIKIAVPSSWKHLFGNSAPVNVY